MSRTARLPTTLLLLSFALLPAVTRAEVVANTGSTRIRFAAREWLNVGLDVNGVRVDRIKLHDPKRIKGLFTKHEQANRGRIVVSNPTERSPLR